MLVGLSGTGISTVPKAIRVSPTPVPATPNAPKPRQKVPKSVQAVTHHTLSFTASYFVGLGYNGELILGDRDSKRYLHKIQHNDKKYIETWEKKLPDGMKYNCNKAVSSDAYIFLQKNKDTNTVCYDESLTKRTELQIQGALIGSISDEVFYAQGILWQTDWQITVHKTVMEGISTSGVLASALQKLQLGEHRTLKPPSPHGWGRWLSVCGMKLGYVVVELHTRSMDIFDEDGRNYFALKLYQIAENSVRK